MLVFVSEDWDDCYVYSFLSQNFNGFCLLRIPTFLYNWGGYPLKRSFYGDDKTQKKTQVCWNKTKNERAARPIAAQYVILVAQVEKMLVTNLWK